MAYNDYPTAKERINSGEWVLLTTKSKRISAIHYYISKRKNNTYRVHYMYCSSKLGVPFFISLQYGCKFLAKPFNLIRKGVGDELFKDIINESKELLRARNHNESTGYAYDFSEEFETTDECLEYIKKDFESKIK